MNTINIHSSENYIRSDHSSIEDMTKPKLEANKAASATVLLLYHRCIILQLCIWLRLQQRGRETRFSGDIVILYS